MSNEYLTDVYKRFGNKIGKDPKELIFYFNSLEVRPCHKTLDQLELKNKNVLNVVFNQVNGA